VYNAAMARTGTALESSPADLAASIAVNALGAHAAAQRFGAAMKQRGRGSILLTGGGLALHPESGYSELSIGKAALRALALCLAGEVAPDVKLAIFEICGAIRLHSSLDPSVIADRYWDVHSGRSPAGEVVLE
jgi:NAD(P)-dependent dehydrogenase (short-subunit alcohol dehydrogenase family)